MLVGEDWAVRSYDLSFSDAHKDHDLNRHDRSDACSADIAHAMTLLSP
jgi:hypothetical protein